MTNNPDSTNNPGVILSDHGIGECDICRKSKHRTHAALAAGRTGRVCEVLWMCTECGEQTAGGCDIVSKEDAREMIEQCDDRYADF